MVVTKLLKVNVENTVMDEVMDSITKNKYVAWS